MVAINEVRLKDFYQAVVLMPLNFPLIRLEKGDQQFVTFVFNDPDFLAEEMLGRYWDGEVQVNAKDLISNIKELKTRLHTKMGSV